MFVQYYMEEHTNYQRCLKCGNSHQIEQPCATNISHFYWPYPATCVLLVGEWSKWQNKEEMVKSQGIFELSVNLKVGVYKYKFVVDGKWVYDDKMPMTADNYGSFNNVIYVAPKTAYLDSADIHQNQDKQTRVKIVSNLIDDDVKIIGSWNNWQQAIPMKRIKNPFKDCEQSIIELVLERGKTYEFKFKVNNQYIIDETYPSIRNQFDSLNNWLIVSTSQDYETPNILKTQRKNSKQSINLETKQWVWQKITIQEFPFYNIHGHSLCNVGDFLYIFGGIAKGVFRNSLIKISVNNFCHCQVEEVDPNPRAFHSASVYGNKLLIFGGLNTTILQDYYCFNTFTDDWITPGVIKGQCPPLRQKGTCVLYKEMLVFFGGYFCSSDIQFETLFNDLSVLDIESMSWKKPPAIKGHLPLGRFAHTANIYGEYMYIFGGEYNVADNKNLNDVWRIHLESQSEVRWECMQISGKPPAPRHGHTTNVIYHYLMIFGGQGDQGIIFNDVTLLDLKNNQWIHPIISGQVPKGRYYHAACKLKSDELIVFGGKTHGQRKNQNIYILKPTEIKKILEFDD